MAEPRPDQWLFVEKVKGVEGAYKCSLCGEHYLENDLTRPIVLAHLIDVHDGDATLYFAEDEGDVEEDSDLMSFSGRNHCGERCPATESESSGAEICSSAPTGLSWFDDPRTKPTEEDVDAAVGRFFFAHLIPFSFANNPYFKEMVTAIQSGGRNLRVPTVGELRGALSEEDKKAIDRKKKAIARKRRLARQGF
eukprot:Gb_31773 [translate_table: standard]